MLEHAESGLMNAPINLDSNFTALDGVTVFRTARIPRARIAVMIGASMYNKMFREIARRPPVEGCPLTNGSQS